MQKYIVVIVILTGCLVASCFSEEGSSKKPLNPNGDSELALLMREMYEDGLRMKREVMSGEKPEVLKKFEKIHHAVATEPDKVSTERYRLYADAYLNAMRMLESSSMPELETAYSAVVESCLNCHRAVCPGPMVRIKKLKLPELVSD